MSEITRLLDQLHQAFDGEPWSGPSLLTTLTGLTAAPAASRPVAAAHSIWEITQHLTAWTGVVRRRLAENQLLQLSDAEDWPPQPALPTEDQWQVVLVALHKAHEQLLTTVAAIPEAGLDHHIGSTFDRPQGLGSTAYATLHGIAQHYLYHAGQIALLRKALSNN
ncbi:DinB family protein [Hymenobacter terrenus]|uniref:DinB family protein n=1 Tax=Hymenobacter terrenus TaxID=1629124 RepID=UPI0006194F8B|nr:DinB family protein [Hymenobacter terrenus]